jgi:hypothetical protein
MRKNLLYTRHTDQRDDLFCDFSGNEGGIVNQQIRNAKTETIGKEEGYDSRLFLVDEVIFFHRDITPSA